MVKRQVALVTGAGGGIGKAIAWRLAKAGHQVLATVRDADRAERLTAEAERDKLSIRYLPLELTDTCQVSAVAARAETEGVQVVVHNAGFGVFGSIEDVDAAATERQFAVHVFGPLALTRQLLPVLRAQHGQIIWIGSLAGRIALPFQAHYSATKSAIASISDALRMELKPFGVRVTCVEPSDFSTGFTRSRTIVQAQVSAYAEIAERCLHEVERQEREAPAPEWVAKVVERLVGHPSPPARLPVGKNARLICLLLSLMPARLAEKMISAHYRV